MNSIEFNEKEAQIMCKVFQWAYNNGIEITLTPRYEYGEKYPEIKFSRDGKCISKEFYPLTNFGPKLNHYWREIAIALIVEPLDLSEFL